VDAIVILFSKCDVSTVIHLEVQVICSMQQRVAKRKFLRHTSEGAKLLQRDETMGTGESGGGGRTEAESDLKCFDICSKHFDSAGEAITERRG